MSAALDFSADGNQLVSGDVDNGVKVWDVTTGHEGKELDALDRGRRYTWLATAPSGGEWSRSSLPWTASTSGGTGRTGRN